MTTVIILALIGFSGQILAVCLAAWLSARNSRRALDRQTADLTENTDAITKVITDTNKVATATHKIVNSQRTEMLRRIAMLARKLADLNPEDSAVQQAATQAEADLKRNEH